MLSISAGLLFDLFAGEPKVEPPSIKQVQVLVSSSFETLVGYRRGRGAAEVRRDSCCVRYLCACLQRTMEYIVSKCCYHEDDNNVHFSVEKH